MSKKLDRKRLLKIAHELDFEMKRLISDGYKLYSTPYGFAWSKDNMNTFLPCWKEKVDRRRLIGD